jgi:hypothetical protein
MSEQPSYGNGTLAYRVSELEKDQQELARKVDRILWMLVSLTLALAGWSIGMFLTFLSVRGRI